MGTAAQRGSRKGAGARVASAPEGTAPLPLWGPALTSQLSLKYLTSFATQWDADAGEGREANPLRIRGQ
jgi:hypothetical protein